MPLVSGGASASREYPSGRTHSQEELEWYKMQLIETLWWKGKENVGFIPVVSCVCSCSLLAPSRSQCCYSPSGTTGIRETNMVAKTCGL